MRFALVLLALGLVMGAPVAPTSVMSQAHAQAATSQEQLETALAAQLLAAAGNSASLSAIIAREQSIGRGALLARALARAAQSLATGGNSGQAATLMTQAISIASGQDASTQQAVGTAAGQVVAQITNTDPASASRIASSAANSGTTTLQMAYSAGQSNQQVAGTGLVGGGGGTGGSQGTQQLGGTTRTTTPVVRRTTRRVVPPRPRIPTTPTVPIVPEPNPQQASGSPT